jgi:hypothetical protein
MCDHSALVASLMPPAHLILKDGMEQIRSVVVIRSQLSVPKSLTDKSSE